MFTKTGPNTVRSLDGFELAIVSRLELYYEDQNDRIVVPIEPMEDGELVVSVTTIAVDRRSELTGRISESLDFLGIRHRFD